MQKLSKLFGEIEARRHTERRSPSYKDAPALREIATLTAEELLDSSTVDMGTIDDAVIILRFLAESYDSLGRFSISAYYYNKLFELCTKAKTVYNMEYDETPHDFYNAVRVRNAYVDDDCADLALLVEPLLPLERIKERISLIKTRRRSIRLDPVETTKEYLAVIDLVDAKLDAIHRENAITSAHTYFLYKQRLLSQYGILWRTPEELNPRVDLSKYEY